MMKEIGYLTEAFRELESLNESDDVFEIDDEGIKGMQEFISNDEDDDTVDIIDDEASTKEDLEDSYVGKVIIDCCVCHSLIYKNADEVVVDEESDLANTDEECPYCHSTGDGYKVVGEVAPFKPEEEVKVEVEKKEDTEDDFSDEEGISDDKSDDDDKDDEKNESIRRRRVVKRVSESIRRKNRKNIRESRLARRPRAKKHITESRRPVRRARVAESRRLARRAMFNESVSDEAINAYVWFFGGAKADAKKALATMDSNKIKALVDGFKSNAKKSFYTESFDDVQITTDTEKITVKSEPKEDDFEGDMIAPISDEKIDAIEANSIDDEIANDEMANDAPIEEVDIDEFDEDSTDELGESFFKRAYSNVKSFKTVGVNMNKGKVVVEGIVTFNSGNKKSTKFTMTPNKVSKSGKYSFIAENAQLCKGNKRPIRIAGSVVGKKFVAESLRYNYSVGNKTVRGVVRNHKKNI